MAHSPHLLAANYLVLIKEGKVLLQRRFQTGWMDGMYGIPAGHIEQNESATTSVIREIKEEIGLTLDPKALSVTHIMHRFADGQPQYIDFFYTTKEWQGEPTICEPEKCDDLTWFPVDQLPNNILPYIAEVIKNISEGVFYSEYGWKI